MSLTRKQAVDEMLALVKTAWQTTAGLDITRVKWENIASSSVPPSGQYAWARVTVRHNESEQASLAGVVGTRMFRRHGVISIQVFEVVGVGLLKTTDLPAIIRNAFEGVTSTGGVIFRRVTINEVGESGDFYQTNVVASFEYDQIK